jgi:hypothetical protein
MKARPFSWWITLCLPCRPERVPVAPGVPFILSGDLTATALSAYENKACSDFDMERDPNQFANPAELSEYRQMIEGFKKQLASRLEAVAQYDLGDVVKTKKSGKRGKTKA